MSTIVVSGEGAAAEFSSNPHRRMNEKPAAAELLLPEFIDHG